MARKYILHPHAPPLQQVSCHNSISHAHMISKMHRSTQELGRYADLKSSKGAMTPRVIHFTHTLAIIRTTRTHSHTSYVKTTLEVLHKIGATSAIKDLIKANAIVCYEQACIAHALHAMPRLIFT